MYDEHWYAGHDLPGYSVLFPPLAWLLGLRVVGALSVLLSVACFEGLTVRAYGASARWAVAAFALAAVGDVWIGRLAFALGVSFGLGAVLALVRGRGIAAGALALLCAAASPVAGVLLALAALTDWLARRSPQALIALAAPAGVVVLALALLFGEGGTQPYPILSFAATVAVVAAFAWALPREQRLLRVGAAIYLLACLLFLLLPTPMGSNIERYGVLLAGPLLVCAVLAQRPRVGGRRTRRRTGGMRGAGACSADHRWSSSRSAHGRHGRGGGRCARRSRWPATSRRGRPTTHRLSASWRSTQTRRCAWRCRSRDRTGRPPSSRRGSRSRGAGRSSWTHASTACCWRAG